MDRRFSVPAAAACFVAGIALWFTRASLDVARGAQDEVRVAMFPSLAELAGLVILTAVVVFLVAALLRRLTGRLTADPLIPLFSLAWLAVPYLPWLPDAVPALRVFAGPARFLVWAIVLGQVAWVAWQTTRDRLSNETREADVGASPRPRRRAWWVLACSAAAFGAAAFIQASGPLHPGGDEPHYLIVAQSVLTDGDLRIEDNHARGDYRAYFDGPLKPDYIARGRGGVIYSIHPIGLPMLIAPAFALGGYRAVVGFLVALAALTAAGAWLWASRRTGSMASATVGWLAVAGSSSYVLHSFAVYPEIAAGAALLAGLAWTPARGSAAMPIVQGAIIGTLPWLGTKYAPMSAVAALALASRHGRSRQTALVLAPYAVSLAAWFGFFWYFWGSPLPAAPYGTAHQIDPRHLLVGLSGLLFDQEYGLLPYAPALLLAVPGLWHMWSRGGTSRRDAIEIVATAGALMATVGAYAMWWGGSSAPARQIVAVLPLFALPVAWWDRATVRLAAVNAGGRALVLAGAAIATVLVVARGGVLSANRRDGSSQLLEWLAPSNDLVRVAPSYIAHRDQLLQPLIVTIAWLGVLALAVVLLRRLRVDSPGRAAPVGLTIVIAAAMTAATAVPPLMGAQIPGRRDPAARAESAMLSRFDARARPLAVVYSPWQTVTPEEIPPLFAFEGRPGLRRDPQPLRVLLNTRLALPAGRYDVELRPTDGRALDGSVGLQLGRTGRPVCDWRARSDPGQPWTQEFRVDVDAPFVGFRTDPALEHAVGEVVVRPRAVVNAAERLDRRLALPPVLAASHYKDVAVYFHDATAYPEADGFWVRGASRLRVTFAVPPDSSRSRVRLEVHPGAAANRVRFSSGAWERELELEPHTAATIDVPVLPRSRRAAVQIATTSGFVPADTGGGSDRRLLGAWVQVVE